MYDTLLRILTRLLYLAGRAAGQVFSWLWLPFRAAGRWYRSKGWILKTVVGVIVAMIAAGYIYFGVQTQVWTGFDPDYVAKLDLSNRGYSAGEQIDATGSGSETRTCGRSAIAQVTADLIDMNVNQNSWLSSMLLYKLGFFGVSWDHTPFFDNKASFQRGINQAVRRTAIELVDTLGRIRGTSQIDSNLQDARGNLQFDEYTWYFGINPFGPKTPTPSFYRSAIRDLNKFNDRLAKCDAVFDARADNLTTFLDRIASDIGSTSAILREQSESNNMGWFDTRADDRFWFAYGQLYGYYGILSAAGADFENVIKQRSVGPLWATTEQQFRAALNIQPFIVSNGNESGWIMPTHLATMGFYVLRVRSNLVELRSVLER